MILGVQIVGILFGAFMAYYSFLHFKRKEFNTSILIFWLCVWLGVVVVSVIPKILDPIATTLNFVRVMDLLMVVGFMFLVGVAFYTFSITKKTEKKVEDLVRQLAVKKR
jgi:hypothetical protein